MNPIYGMNIMVAGYEGPVIEVKRLVDGQIFEIYADASGVADMAEIARLGEELDSDIVLHGFISQNSQDKVLVQPDETVLYTWVAPVTDYDKLMAAYDDAGVVLSNGEKGAYKRLIDRLKLYKIWDKLDGLYMFDVAKNKAQAEIDIKTATANLTPTHDPNAITHVQGKGITTDGTGAYWLPNTYNAFTPYKASVITGTEKVDPNAEYTQYMFGVIEDVVDESGTVTGYVFNTIFDRIATRWEWGLNASKKLSINNGRYPQYDYVHLNADEDAEVLWHPGDMNSSANSYSKDPHLPQTGWCLGAVNARGEVIGFWRDYIKHFAWGGDLKHHRHYLEAIIRTFKLEMQTGVASQLVRLDGIVGIENMTGSFTFDDKGFVRGMLEKQLTNYKSEYNVAKSLRVWNQFLLADYCETQAHSGETLDLSFVDANLDNSEMIEMWFDDNKQIMYRPGMKWKLTSTTPTTIVPFPMTTTPGSKTRHGIEADLENEFEMSNIDVIGHVEPWKAETYLCKVDSINRSKLYLTDTRVDEMYVREWIQFYSGSIREGFHGPHLVGKRLYVARESLRNSEYKAAIAAYPEITEVGEDATGKYVIIENEVPAGYPEVYLSDYFAEDVTIQEVLDFGQNVSLPNNNCSLGFTFFTDNRNQVDTRPAIRRFSNVFFNNLYTAYHKSGGAVWIYNHNVTYGRSVVGYSIHNGDYGTDTRLIMTGDCRTQECGIRLISSLNVDKQGYNLDWALYYERSSKNILGSGGYTHPNTICEVEGVVLENATEEEKLAEFNRIVELIKQGNLLEAYSSKLISWVDNHAGAHRQYSASGGKTVFPGAKSFYRYIFFNRNKEYNQFLSEGMPTTVENAIYINGSLVTNYNNHFKNCLITSDITNKSYAQPEAVDADGNLLPIHNIFEDCYIWGTGLVNAWYGPSLRMTIEFKNTTYHLSQLPVHFTEQWGWHSNDWPRTMVYSQSTNNPLKELVLDGVEFTLNPNEDYSNKNFNVVDCGNISRVVVRNCTTQEDWTQRNFGNLNFFINYDPARTEIVWETSNSVSIPLGITLPDA